MSASQQKKTRAQRREDGADKRITAQKKAEAAAKREKRNVTITCIVLAVVILVLVGFNSNILYNNFAAAKVGNMSFTASEYSFFYKSAYQSYLSYYESYGMLDYIGIDREQPLDKQQFSETQTWADYFKDEALTTMKSVVMLYTEAQNAGYTLDAEQETELQARIDSYSSYYSLYNYPSANSFLAAQYGRGLTEKRVAKLVRMSYIAEQFATSKAESFIYTDEELSAHYAEKAGEFDNFTYLSYFSSGAVPSAEDGGEPEIDAETAMADAKAFADKIISDEPLPEPEVEPSDITDVPEEPTEGDEAAEEAEEIEVEIPDVHEAPIQLTPEAEFIERVLALAGTEITEQTTVGSDLTYYFSDEAAEWLRDSSRKNGDKTVIEGTDGYHTIFYVSRESNDYDTVDVRHILAQATADEDGVFTDEAKDAAKTRIDEIYAEWNDGDKTEDRFAEMANEHSDDGGSNTNGGLYEKIAKGQMVAEFNDWIFDPARKTGDTGIVFNEGSYCGYHIIYFVGHNDPYWKVLSENDIRKADYNAWSDAQLEGYTATTGFTASLVK